MVMSGVIGYRLFGPRQPRPVEPLGSTDIGLGEIFDRLLGRHLDVSTGAAVPADPYHLVIGVLSLLFFGHVDVMVRSLLLAAPILAAITAYVGAGSVLTRRWVRGFAALLWIASPLFTTALSDGRLGVILVWICAPLVALTLCRSLTTGSIAAAAGTGLLLFVITAGVPLLLLVTVLGTAVLLVAGRGLRHLWLLAPTVFLGWPWLWAVVRGPGALLTMPGQTIATDSAPTYLLAVGAPLDRHVLAVGLISDLRTRRGLCRHPATLGAGADAADAHPRLLHPHRSSTRTLPPDLGCRPLPRRSHPRRDQVHLPAQTGPFHLIGSYLRRD